MRAALPLGAVGDANAALHDEIVAILMGALGMYAHGLRGVVVVMGGRNLMCLAWFGGHKQLNYELLGCHSFADYVSGMRAC
jgi:hypothetical protein